MNYMQTVFPFINTPLLMYTSCSVCVCVCLCMRSLKTLDHRTHASVIVIENENQTLYSCNANESVSMCLLCAIMATPPLGVGVLK